MSDELVIAKLEFILESIELIQIWFKDIKTADDYLSTTTGRSHFDATLMRLQSIGGSLKKIANTHSALFSNYPHTPWREIIRLREIISHHYEQLSNEIIFEICKHNLPQLYTDPQNIIQDIRNSK